MEIRKISDTEFTRPMLAENINPQNEREWLRGPLSRRINYRLIVSGEPGPKEIAKLIKLLEAQKAVLTEDENEAAKT